MSYRLSVDVGGTFTDIVLFNTSTKEIYTTKTSSTPKDQSIGLIEGINKISNLVGLKDYNEISYFIHGTTVATNALLERKGAKTALITTEGFRDVFEIARQRRPHLYNFWIKRPKPPIPRHLIFEISERILFDGKIEKNLDVEQAKEIIRKLKKNKVESVAICFLHSYLNPENELKMKNLILEEMPGIFVSTSYETLPEIREYERTCTTAVNAYLVPKVQKYIKNLVLKKERIGIKPKLHIMQSNGGIMSSDIAATRSIHTVFSGPAGGVLAGQYISRLIGEPNVITLDMGGTSTDIVLMKDSKIKLTTDGDIGSFPIKVPMIEMHTIGTGGGSIAWVDTGGALQVGPSSAGADPGPVCYGLGNEEPTVTDANLVLGRLNKNNFLGGEKKIFLDKSRNAIDKKISSKLGLSITESASGMLDVVNSNMCGGVKVISTQKGYDLRDFSLIAFGGAGSLHAVELANSLNMKSTIVPFSPGNFSAIGCMLSEIRYDYVRTLVKEICNIKINDYNSLYLEMKKEAILHLKAEGYSEENIIFHGFADMCYAGQAWELSVEVPSRLSDAKDLKKIRNKFEEIHKRTYGYILKREEVVFVNLRLSAIGVTPKLQMKSLPINNEKSVGVNEKKRDVFYKGEFIKFEILNRDKLLPGNKFVGPLIIEEYASSTVIPPEKKVEIDEFKNIIITN